MRWPINDSVAVAAAAAVVVVATAPTTAGFVGVAATVASVVFVGAAVAVFAVAVFAFFGMVDLVVLVLANLPFTLCPATSFSSSSSSVSLEPSSSSSLFVDDSLLLLSLLLLLLSLNGAILFFKEGPILETNPCFCGRLDMWINTVYQESSGPPVGWKLLYTGAIAFSIVLHLLHSYNLKKRTKLHTIASFVQKTL